MKRITWRVLLSVAVCLGGCAGRTESSPAKEAQAQAAVDARRAFLQLIDRPRVALLPEVREGAGGAGQTWFSFASQAGERVPGILLKPAAGGPAGQRRPVVIAMHGTGGNKLDHLPFLRDMTARGFIGVAIDGRFHGERTVGAERLRGLNAYETAILKAYCDTPRMMMNVFGHGARPVEEPFYPLYYDTVWDVMRLVDYLRTREDVDGGRIGIYGTSKGGIETYLAGAADPRIACVVSAIGVQTFRYGLVKNAWQGRVATVQKAFDEAATATGIGDPDARFVEVFYNRVMPGIIDEFDGPGLLPRIAPRPLLVINSDNDRNTPVEGVKLAAQAARDAYAEAKPPAPERFEFILQPGAGHRVTPESQRAAVEWFARWLGAPR